MCLQAYFEFEKLMKQDDFFNGSEVGARWSLYTMTIEGDDNPFQKVRYPILSLLLLVELGRVMEH